MHITIIEDEKILSSNIAKRLSKNWYNVRVINSFNEYMKNRIDNTDLYIIDISLRDWCWFDIIKDLRETRKLLVPIIITSWYTDTDKKIYWLDIWADDYLSKPYSVDELIARIRVNIRRTYKSSLTSIIEYNNINYDTSKKVITISWKIIKLTWNELLLAEYMIFNVWKIVTKTEIINSVWWSFDELKVSDNTITVTVSNLRKKLWNSFNLKTIHNRWYLLE